MIADLVGIVVVLAIIGLWIGAKLMLGRATEGLAKPYDDIDEHVTRAELERRRDSKP